MVIVLISYYDHLKIHQMNVIPHVFVCFCVCAFQNPTWRSLDFGMLPDLLDTSVSCFVVRIWGGQEEHYQLLIEWKVNLDGLRYTGQQVSKHTTYKSEEFSISGNCVQLHTQIMFRGVMCRSV